jgi:formate-dependent phosphoribosylglycinamide formyltransferase (GAR transformylase)
MSDRINLDSVAKSSMSSVGKGVSMLRRDFRFAACYDLAVSAGRLDVALSVSDKTTAKTTTKIIV